MAANQPAAAPRGFKEKVWQPLLGPVVALVAICLVTSFLLALTNDITLPLIQANVQKEADAARQQVLPAADSFEEVAITADVPGVTSLYEATNGAGWVIEAAASGYGGDVPVMVAFDTGGTIVGVQFLSNNETPGLGKKLETDAAFAGQFAGQEAVQRQLSDIDTIASATVSSVAALTAVNSAVALYDAQVRGLDVDGVASATEGGEAE